VQICFDKCVINYHLLEIAELEENEWLRCKNTALVEFVFPAI
jgi:hypothetical protein